MADKNTDFLRFNAYSIKDLITRKLSENSKFSDQIYEGSNLAILIDIVSYMYQCLLLNLNNCASESMFADTQIYENINRLCKFIGYNPRGCSPSQIVVVTNPTGEFENVKIPLFSKVDTGITDNTGRKVCFSVAESGETVQGYQHITNLVNGEFKLYNTIFTSSGIENEKFILTGLESNDQKDGSQSHVSQSYFHIYVKKDDNTIEEWSYDKENILMRNYKDDDNPSFANIYNGDDKVFNIRLNEDKVYELKFGDGRIGAKLPNNSHIYVFYLATNGEGGNLDLETVDNSGLKFQHTPSMFGMNDVLYENIFGIKPGDDHNIQNKKDDYLLTIKNNSLIEYKSEESVEDIRESAPNFFKTGNRLITAKDYQYFIKNNPKFSDVVSVKCMNNWEYMTSFFKWLYYYGINYNKVLRSDEIGKKRPNTTISDAFYYLQQQRVESNEYKFVDAADACNIYLWMELQDNDNISIKNQYIDDEMQYLKTMTSEVYAISPIHVEFDICACDQLIELKSIYSRIDDGTVYDVADNGSYIEITLDDNSIYVASDIQRQVISIIHSYFNQKNCQIGQLVDYNDIMQKIYQINGVVNIRTIFEPNKDLIENGYKTIIKNGLSFASFSTDMLDLGEDLDISNSSKKLELFQFPRLYKSKDANYWLNKVKVIKKSLSNISPIKY